ncbi:MAG: hypothetical protein V4623_05835, partial [Pseudomonadota bacterium]
NPTTHTLGDNPSNGSNGQALANQQNQVLLDFLAIYSATQKDGTWGFNHISGDPLNTNTIRTALFGDGTQTGGLIDAQRLLLGGSATPLGAGLDAKSLGDLMGNVAGVNYADWVAPLQQAMAEFDISTPQRIAAFLAETGHETGGLGKMTEDIGPYSVKVFLGDFKPAYTTSDNAVDTQKNPNKAGERWTDPKTGVQTILSARQARFLNLQGFVKNELGLNDLDGYTINDIGRDGVDPASAVEKIVIGQGSWTEVRQKMTANRHYSSDVGNGGTGNGTEASNDGWNFIGRGLFHLTGRANYTPFANYIQTNHPELVQASAGKTVAQTLLSQPTLIGENTPNGRILSALAGAWYWVNHPNQRTVDRKRPTAPPIILN